MGWVVKLPLSSPCSSRVQFLIIASVRFVLYALVF